MLLRHAVAQLQFVIEIAQYKSKLNTYIEIYNTHKLISGSPFVFLSLLASLNTVSIQDCRRMGILNCVSSEQWVVRCLASVFIPSSVIESLLQMYSVSILLISPVDSSSIL